MLQLGVDMANGKFKPEDDYSQSVSSLLEFRRNEAMKRVAGSYAFFGFVTFLSGTLFLIKGTLAIYVEVTDASLRAGLTNPIVTSVIPEAVPVICMLEVLLPFGLTSYVKACGRPIEALLSSKDVAQQLTVEANVSSSNYVAASISGVASTPGTLHKPHQTQLSDSARAVSSEPATEKVA